MFTQELWRGESLPVMLLVQVCSRQGKPESGNLMWKLNPSTESMQDRMTRPGLDMQDKAA